MRARGWGRAARTLPVGAARDAAGRAAGTGLGRFGRSGSSGIPRHARFPRGPTGRTTTETPFHDP